MTTWLRFLLFTPVLFMFVLAPARAQREDDVLRPVPFRFHLGPMLGFGYNSSHGSFKTLCDCEYDGGYGVGPVLGGFIDYPLTRSLSAYVLVQGQSLNADYDRTERRFEYVQQLGDFAAVDFEQEVALTLFTAGIGAFVKWETPVPNLYLAVGPDFSLVVVDGIEETERIITPGFAYTNSGGGETVFVDGALDDYYDGTAWRLAIAGKIGYIIPIAERLQLAAEITAALPMTPVVAEHNSWRIMPYQFSVLARFAL